MPTTRLQISINTLLLRRIETYCKKTGVSKSQLVTMAVNEFLHRWGV